MFPDLSKAADALSEARDLMQTLIAEVKQLREDNLAWREEVRELLERKENASI